MSIPLAGLLASLLSLVLGVLSILWWTVAVEPTLQGTALSGISGLALVGIVAGAGGAWYLLFRFFTRP